MKTPKFRTKLSKKAHKRRAAIYAAAHKVLNDEAEDVGLCYALDETADVSYMGQVILKAELAEAIGFDLISQDDDSSFWPVLHEPDTKKGRNQRLDLLMAAEAYHRRRAKAGT